MAEEFEEEVGVKVEKGLYLQTRNSVREYARDEMVQLFADMRSEMGEVTAKKFYEAATCIGTHAPKLTNPRSKQGAFIVPGMNGNRPVKLGASKNGAIAGYCKVLLRPIKMVGEEGEFSLFERVMSKSADVDGLMSAFGEVFGESAAEFALNGMVEQTGLAVAGESWSENFPIVYAPTAGNETIQVALVGKIEAVFAMDTVKWNMRKQAKIDRTEKRPATYGEWSELGLTNHMQNVLVDAPKLMTRFAASVPSMLMNSQAEMYRFKAGGRFPRLRDAELINAIIEYVASAEDLADTEEYRNANMLRGLTNRVVFIARGAAQHIQETLEDLSLEEKEALKARIPTISELLSGVFYRDALMDFQKSNKGYEHVTEVLIRNRLNSSEFVAICEEFEVAE